MRMNFALGDAKKREAGKSRSAVLPAGNDVG
jgi:hypothetical protein